MRLSSRSIYAILPLFLLFQLLTQPFFVLAGDPVAIRYESRQLLNHHRLGIPFANKSQIPANFLPPQSQPDQYFWENQDRQLYFSRWGLTNSLAFLVPLALAGADGEALRLIVALNFWNALLATMLLGAMLGLSRSAKAGLWGILCIFAYFFGTAISYYLRAQSSEMLQMVQLGLVLWLYRKLNSLIEKGEAVGWTSRPMRLMVVMSLLLTTLVHTKVYFCLFFGLTLVTLFWRRLSQKDARRLAYCGAFFIALCGLLQLALNYYKFGHVLEMGLGPAFPRTKSDWYDLAHFKKSLPDYLVGQNGSVFLYFPFIIFAILGAKGHARLYRRESCLIWLNFLAIIVVAGGWQNNRGEWCFGPRYLVPAISLTVVPAMFAYRKVADYGWRDTRRALFSLIFAALLVLGVKRQAVVAQLDFFALQQVTGSLQEINEQIFADRYFQSTDSYQVTDEFLKFCRGGRTGRFHLLDRSIKLMYPDLRGKLNQLWQDECVYNLYFLALDRSRWFSSF